VKGAVEDATKWLAGKGIEKLNPGADIDWATSTASLVASKGIDYLFGDAGGAKVGQPQDKAQFSGRDSWQSNARGVWNQAIKNGHHSLDLVLSGDKPWRGDVNKYEQQYGAKFTDDQGRIMTLNKIIQDPRALLAYNEWLKDPAVIRATDRFVNREEGLPGGH
jgi:hypothetical protein